MCRASVIRSSGQPEFRARGLRAGSAVKAVANPFLLPTSHTPIEPYRHATLTASVVRCCRKETSEEMKSGSIVRAARCWETRSDLDVPEFCCPETQSLRRNWKKRIEAQGWAATGAAAGRSNRMDIANDGESLSPRADCGNAWHTTWRGRRDCANGELRREARVRMVGADGGSTKRGRVARGLEPDTYTDAHTTAEAAASHTHADAGPRRVVAGTIRRIAVTVWRSSSTSRDGSRQRQDAEKSEHDLLPVHELRSKT